MCNVIGRSDIMTRQNRLSRFKLMEFFHFSRHFMGNNLFQFYYNTSHVGRQMAVLRHFNANIILPSRKLDQCFEIIQLSGVDVVFKSRWFPFSTHTSRSNIDRNEIKVAFFSSPSLYCQIWDAQSAETKSDGIEEVEEVVAFTTSVPHSPESRRIVFVGDYKWESIFSVFNPHLICCFCSRTRTTQQIESDCVLCHYDRRSRRALIKFIVPNSIYVNQQAMFSLSLSSRGPSFVF